jgi:hypothetical protein
MKGKGVNLPLPGPVSGSAYFNQTSGVTAQLVASNVPGCWQAMLPTKKRNTAVLFRAVTP